MTPFRLPILISLFFFYPFVGFENVLSLLNFLVPVFKVHAAPFSFMAAEPHWKVLIAK